ncbi:MAG TPA: indole-3-glycerol phosphate synthase TrpC [Bacteroidales bacterium]|nr:indole-3-glycerol phosphate synthase TrpC [Bacteroidales bacterium]
MTILDNIIAAKRSEVKLLKRTVPTSQLQKSNFFEREAFSLFHSIMKENSTGIIAEFKRRSPSAGLFHNDISPAKVASGYCLAKASAISVLTDRAFFGGTINDLEEVRKVVDCPVLRKDFVIDEYQVIEAKASGADAILLISEVLPAHALSRLHSLATSLGLEIIVEIHDKKNIDSLPAGTKIAGINNRNLATLDVNLGNSEELAGIIPAGIIKVAESGIRSPEDYIRMKKSGFEGFLIGEYFMKNIDPGLACKTFIKEIHECEN